jgi:hypothetical protein
MKRTSVLTVMGAFLALWSGSATAQSETHGCACIENQTPLAINYEWKWADNAYAKGALNAGASQKLCWKYLNPNDQASPPLRVRYDYDLNSSGVQLHEYILERVRANNPPTCAGVGKQGSYHFRRTHNNTQIQLSRVAQ